MPRKRKGTLGEPYYETAYSLIIGAVFSVGSWLIGIFVGIIASSSTIRIGLLAMFCNPDY